MPESDPEGLGTSSLVDQDDLFQREWVFGFDPAELTNRKPAAGVALQVFDVGSGTCAGFFQRLHWAVAVSAAHNLVSLTEGFIECAWQPAAAHFDLALRHHRRSLLSSHLTVRCIALAGSPSCAEYQSRRCQGSEIREQKSRIAKFTLDIDETIHNHMVVNNLDTTFAALSDPTRRAMIERLSHGPTSVHGLTEPFALSQQMISKHIACLVRARIVIKTKRGRESVCTLRPEAIKTVSDWAIRYRRFWEESFDKLEVVVNQMKKEETRDGRKHG